MYIYIYKYTCIHLNIRAGWTALHYACLHGQAVAVHAYLCIYFYYICIYIYIHTNIYAHTHVRTQKCIHLHMIIGWTELHYACLHRQAAAVHEYTCIYSYVYTYMHTFIYVHMYIHT